MLVCDKCSGKRLPLASEAAQAQQPATPKKSSAGAAGAGGAEEAAGQRVCDGCFNRLSFEAALPSLDHFRLRQLKRCAADLGQALERLLLDMEGGDADPEGPGAAAFSTPLRDTFASPPGTPLPAASRLRSPPPPPSPQSVHEGAGARGEAAEGVVELLRVRQTRLMQVEHVVHKYLEVGGLLRCNAAVRVSALA